MRHLNYMNAQDVNEVSRIWISTELNPVEGENMWQDKSSLIEAQKMISQSYKSRYKK